MIIYTQKEESTSSDTTIGGVEFTQGPLENGG